MKTRVKNIDGIGYFGQIKKSFFGKWETIGQHQHGFGLYAEDNLSWPLVSLDEAITVINEFIAWESKTKGWVTHYEIKQ